MNEFAGRWPSVGHINLGQFCDSSAAFCTETVIGGDAGGCGLAAAAVTQWSGSAMRLDISH